MPKAKKKDAPERPSGRAAGELRPVTLEPDFAKAYKSLAGQVNIPGFRPGKAPAKLLESRIGRPAVLEQVINDMIPARYSQAVDEHELVVLAQPEIEVTKLEDNDVVEVTADLPVLGPWGIGEDLTVRGRALQEGE